MTDKVFANNWEGMGVEHVEADGHHEVKGVKMVDGEYDAQVKYGPLSGDERELRVGAAGGLGRDVVVESGDRELTVSDFRAMRERGKRKDIEREVARAGLVGGVEELAMLVRYLPSGFLRAYLQLIDKSVGERNLGSGGGAGDDLKLVGVEREESLGLTGVVGDNGKAKRRRAGEDASLVKVGGQKAKKSRVLFSSEDAMDYRRKVDRKLRMMGREALEYLNDVGTVAASRVCTGSCKRLGDGEWLFCPNCGGPMAERDQPKSKKK